MLTRLRSPHSPARRELLWGLIFVSPGIVYFLVFWIVPVIMTAAQSLWHWTANRPTEYIGLENYADLLSDPFFFNSVRASAGITLGSLVFGVLIAFGLALLLNDDTLRGRRWFRLVIFMPVVTDWVATGLAWQLIFLPDQGVLAGIFHGIGLRGLTSIRWTATRELAPIAIIILVIWKTTGLYMVIFLAGMKSIPAELLEAARSDGADSWQLARHVMLPMLAPITVFVIMLSFVSAIGLFEPVYLMTKGGPVDATKTLPLFIYETFFPFRDGGYASAAAILFLIITLLFAVLAARQIRLTAYEK